MESFQSAVQLLKKDYWMADLSLKDLFEFTCLPNGLATAPRIVTKLMKPAYATLRSKGYLIVGYIDDILLLAKAPLELAQVVAETVALLRSLGFTIHDVSQHQPWLPNLWDSD